MKYSKNEKVENWVNEINKISNEINSTLKNLPIEKMIKSPLPGKWSISQILEHIIKTNETYFPIPEKIKDGNYHISIISKIPLIPKIFGKIILSSVKPQNLRKVKTFPIWEPNFVIKENNIVNLFLEHNNMLINFIMDNVELISERTIISSPANKNIVYRFETAIEIMIAHEQRHLHQIKEVLTLI